MKKAFFSALLVASLVLSSVFQNVSAYVPDEGDSEPVVVFLPGIMGTELWLDENNDGESKCVWPNLWDDGDDINYDRYNLNTEIQITAGLPLGYAGSEATNIKVKDLNFYREVESFFGARAHLHTFSYDWRHSGSYNAQRLKTFIDQVKKNEGVSKVNIVAHSMGGIVAKRYILDTKGDSVAKFITIGTPFFGAPLAFDRLENGYFELNGWFEVAAQRNIVTIPSVYELLPNKMYFDLNKTAYLGERKLNVDGSLASRTAYSYEQTKQELENRFRSGLVSDAEDFHDNMTDSVGQYINQEFYRIIGDSQQTPGFLYDETYYQYYHGYAVPMHRWVQSVVNGDGTVPLLGAARGKDKTWYVPDEHTGLVRNNDVLQAAWNILNGESVTLQDTPHEPNGLSISIYDSNVDEFQARQNSPMLASLSTESVASTPFNPKIKLRHSDGSEFVFQDGKILSNPHNIKAYKIGSTIDLAIDSGDYSLSVDQSESGNSSVGVIVSKIENGVNTRRVDYQNLDLTQGMVLGHISNQVADNDIGLDLDRDGVIDQHSTPIESAALNDNVNPAYDEDQNQNPPPNPQDPPDDPGDGSVMIDISGTSGKFKWFTSPVTITGSTSIVIPDKTDNQSGNSGTTGSETPTGHPPALSLKVDNGPEIASSSYSFSEDGKHSVTVYAKDTDGSIVGQATKSFKIDKTKPFVQTQAAAVHGENGWLISNAEVSVGASDETSKLARVDYSLDSLGKIPYQRPMTVTSEGSHLVYAEAEDNAGNLQSTQQSFKIDKTKPVISDVYLQDEYYWDQDFPIQFNVTDAVSGVASINATINGHPVTNGGKYHFTEPGWHTYRIEVKDQAGWKAIYETKFEVYIPAKINFDPDSLQLDHGGGMATTFIELPPQFSPDNINFSTVQLNGKTVHVQDPQYGYVKNPIGDYDDNGIPDTMLKYERESLINVMAPGNDLNYKALTSSSEPDWKNTVITIFGEWGQYHLKGYDHIQVSNKGYTPPPPDVTPPTVSVEPIDGATNVSVDGPPIFTFSEPVLLPGGAELSDSTAKEMVQLTNSSGQAISFTANWMKNTRTIQINPALQLVGNQTYTLEFKPGTAVDLANNRNAYFRSTFKTENYPIIIDPPLPIPVIELETASTTQQTPPQQSTTQTTSSTTASGTVNFGSNVMVLSDTAITNTITQSTDKVAIPIDSTDNKIALSMGQVNQLSSAKKSLEIKFHNVTFDLMPESLKVGDSTVDYVLLGAETVDDTKKQDIINHAENHDKLLFMGDKVYHFTVSAVTRDNVERSSGHFNGKINVSVPVPDKIRWLANKGRLQVARFNETTNSWDAVTGKFASESGKFEFETDKFSNWTFIVPGKTYSDITGHWAQQDIELLTSGGVLNGVGNDHFNPEQKVTRAEFATMLGNVLNLTQKGTTPFVDIQSNDWFYSNVNRAYTAGLIKGNDENHFSPNDYITREQMVVMINNALTYQKIQGTGNKDSLNKFFDGALISEWAKDAAANAVNLGIVKGENFESIILFAPKDHATRAESAVMLKSFLDQM